MKKSWKRGISLLCAALLSASVTGCGPKIVDDKPIDKGKMQLYVGNYNGGVGQEWLDNVIKRFESDFEHYKFSEDTEGIQVRPSPIDSNDLDSLGLATRQQEVYFLENVNYYDGISKGYFLEITDMVQEKLTAYDEEESIEDKLYDSQVNFYKTPNGKYYGLPHSQSPTLLTYDADLFNRNALYFDANGNLGKRSTDSGLSKGPDNLPNTYDDGLPATYEQFYKLCAEMKNTRGIAPMLWSGKYKFYIPEYDTIAIHGVFVWARRLVYRLSRYKRRRKAN